MNVLHSARHQIRWSGLSEWIREWGELPPHSDTWDSVSRNRTPENWYTSRLITSRDSQTRQWISGRDWVAASVCHNVRCVAYSKQVIWRLHPVKCKNFKQALTYKWWTSYDDRKSCENRIHGVGLKCAFTLPKSSHLRIRAQENQPRVTSDNNDIQFQCGQNRRLFIIKVETYLLV